MFWTIIAVLVILWLVGFIHPIAALGGMTWLIHVLLVIAIIAVLYRIIMGRRAF